MLISLILATGASLVCPLPVFESGVEAESSVRAQPEFQSDRIVIGPKSLGLIGLAYAVGGVEQFSGCGWTGDVKTWSHIRFRSSTFDAGSKVYALEQKFPLKDGGTGTLTRKVRMREDGKIEVSQLADSFNYTFFLKLPTATLLGTKVRVNGKPWAELPSNEQAFAGFKLPEASGAVGGCMFFGYSRIEFATADERPRFAFEIDKAAIGRITLGCKAGSSELIFHPTKGRKGNEVKVVFDPGPTYLPKTPHEKVAGVDFMEENGFHVAHCDHEQNALMNGGFESGFRYWKGPSRDLSRRLSTDARTGRFAYRNTGDLDSSIKSVGTVLKPSTDYEIRCYAKVAKDVSDLAPNGRYPVFTSVQGLGGGRETIIATCRMDAMGLRPEDGWQPLTGSFRTRENTHEVFLMLRTDPRLVIDDLQVGEKGRLDESAGNPFGLELVTGSEDPLCVDANRKNGRIALAVRGKPGTAGSVVTEAESFMGARQKPRRSKLDIPASGEQRIDLGPDGTFPKGINRIKVEICSDSSKRPVVDYLRFARFAYRNGKDRHRFLQGTHRYASVNPTTNNFAEVEFRRLMHLGVGNLGYVGDNANKGEYMTADDYRTLKSFGLIDFWGNGGVIHNKNWKAFFWDAPAEWNGVNYKQLDSYPDDYLALVERKVREQTEANPFVQYWSLPTEPCGSFATLRAGNMAEYAKFILACWRGVKAVNPKAWFCPFGDWNMGEQGRSRVCAMLKHCRALDSACDFKVVEIHTYRSFPENPDLEKDLLAFLRELDDAGFPKIKVKTGEGSYYFPMFRPGLGLYPWSGVAAHDGYSHIVMPSYDLGWGERIGAAMTTRETIVYLKHADRVVANASWNPFYLDNDCPLGWTVAHAALMEMLGDAVCTDDIRFSPKSRLMVFDNRHGSAVGFLWRADDRFDRGLGGRATCRVNLKKLHPLFYDLMGNEGEPETDGSGNAILPLTGFPVYVKVPLAERQMMVDAFSRAVVPEDSAIFPVETAFAVRTPETAVLTLVNTITRPLAFRVTCAGVTRDVSLDGLAETAVEVPLSEKVTSGKYVDCKTDVTFVFEGRTFADSFSTRAVAVPYSAKAPDWASVPPLKLDFSQWTAGGRHDANTFKANYRMAWNERELRLRVEADDDIFHPARQKDFRQWGADADQLCLFFDAFGNGRVNARHGEDGYDYDDFSFAFVPTDAKTACCVRTRAPDHQFTGGATDGFKSNTLEPNIKTSFAHRGGKATWEITMPLYYLMPLKLSSDSAPGFCIQLYDHDRDELDVPCVKRCGNLDENPNRPAHYPQLIFVK